MREEPIGIFDSGVGGLGIFLSLRKILPQETFIYLADQKNCPYGNKTPAELKKIALRNTGFLIEKKCKLIVIACNTITTGYIDYLRKIFKKDIFVGVVPPVKPAAKATKTGHFIILSTRLTQKSKYLNNLIKRFARRKKVYNLSCPGLVELIESGFQRGKKVQEIVRRAVSPALKDKKIDVIATGCTHYPFVKDTILNLFHQPIKFIEPAFAVARQVVRILHQKNILALRKETDKFFTTGNRLAFEKSFRKLMGFKIKVKEIKL